MTAKKATSSKKSAKAAPVDAPEKVDLGKEAQARADESRAAIEGAIPLKKPKANTATLAAKMTDLFAQLRATLMESHDDFPKTPRMLRLALTAIQMAEDATTRHFRHNG